MDSAEFNCTIKNKIKNVHKILYFSEILAVKKGKMVILLFLIIIM